MSAQSQRLDAEPVSPDPRVQRTRAALLGAFNELMLSVGYDAIRPAAIARAAGVGRSTFYDHYAGKADLLAQSVTVVLTPLADATVAAAPGPGVEAVLTHFQQNRRLARAMLAGRPRTIMAARLQALIEARLVRRSVPGAVPAALAACQLAHGMLAVINAWLSGRHPCSVQALARHLEASARAAIAP